MSGKVKYLRYGAEVKASVNSTLSQTGQSPKPGGSTHVQVEVAVKGMEDRTHIR